MFIINEQSGRQSGKKNQPNGNSIIQKMIIGILNDLAIVVKDYDADVNLLP